MGTLLFSLDNYNLYIEEEYEPNEATKKYYTLEFPNKTIQTVDFTSYDVFDLDCFKAIIILNNPKRPEPVNNCSVPWNSKSLKQELAIFLTK